MCGDRRQKVPYVIYTRVTNAKLKTNNNSETSGTQGFKLKEIKGRVANKDRGF